MGWSFACLFTQLVVAALEGDAQGVAGPLDGGPVGAEAEPWKRRARYCFERCVPNMRGTKIGHTPGGVSEDRGSNSAELFAPRGNGSLNTRIRQSRARRVVMTP